MNRTTALRALAVLAGLSVLVWAVVSSGVTPVQALTAIESLREMGPKGFVVFVGVYALLTWLMVPASWQQGAAGFLYGPIGGFLFAWVGSTFFGWVSFVLARGRLRALFAHRLQGRVSTLDRALTRSGWKLVALLRVPPVSPYNVINYALGLTGVSHRDYLVGSALGALVPVLVYTQVGASLSELASLLEGESQGPAGAQFVVLGVTLVAAVGVTRIVRRELAEATGD